MKIKLIMHLSKILLPVILIFSSVAVISQKTIDENRKEIIISYSSGIGLSSFEFQDMDGVLVGTSHSIESELYIKRGYSLRLGLSYFSYSGNFVSNNSDLTFLRNGLMEIPIYMNQSISFKHDDFLVFSFGTYIDFHLRSEQITGNTKRTLKNLGYKFGLIGKISYRKYLNERLGFNIGIVRKNDLILTYKEKTDELKASTHYLEFDIFLRF